MMRNTLFRGKRKDNGEWVYGYLLRGKYYLDEIEMTTIFSTDTIFYPNTETTGYDWVFPETVGQFTGLTDRYEKKIFEGDIVNIITGINGYKSTYHSTIQEVKYIADSGIAVFRPFDNSDIVEIEVIGNIYDNEELLENDKDKG